MYIVGSFSDGMFRSVWVENINGLIIARFPCDHENWDEAMKYAKVLVSALNG